MLAQPQLTKNGNSADPLLCLQGGLGVGDGELHQLLARDSPSQGVFGADSQTRQQGGYSKKRTKVSTALSFLWKKLLKKNDSELYS